MVREVVPGGAAEYASLRVGDMLIGVEGQPLLSLDDLEQALEGDGERLLRLQFVRGDPAKIRNVAVRLGVLQAAIP
jgi:S1-C subfamily serine protease